MKTSDLPCATLPIELMKEVLLNYLDQEGLEEDHILSPLFTIEEEQKRMKYRGIHQEELVPINMIPASQPEPGPRRPALSLRPSNSTDDGDESTSSSRQLSVNSLVDGQASEVFDQQGDVIENAGSLFQEEASEVFNQQSDDIENAGSEYQEQANEVFDEVFDQQPDDIENASREETLWQVIDKEDTNVEKRKQETLNKQ